MLPLHQSPGDDGGGYPERPEHRRPGISRMRRDRDRDRDTG